jgi:hypothetical protein
MTCLGHPHTTFHRVGQRQLCLSARREFGGAVVGVDLTPAPGVFETAGGPRRTQPGTSKRAARGDGSATTGLSTSRSGLHFEAATAPFRAVPVFSNTTHSEEIHSGH